MNKIKVLWLEITTPTRYNGAGTVVCGWQDALESIVRKCEKIELSVAFEAPLGNEAKIIDGVRYFPINTKYDFWENQMRNYSYDIVEKKIVKGCVELIKELEPDIIHVFGNEWPFGLVASQVNIPVVLHIQGSMIPYLNALYPPNYNRFDMILSAGINLRKQFRFWKKEHNAKSRRNMEMRTWDYVKYFMGRTRWDRGLVNVFSNNGRYFHVEEALRPEITNSVYGWKGRQGGKVKLVTIGMTNFWKGPDMLLKTASVLNEVGFDFEWKIAGRIDEQIKKTVEKKEKRLFSENNIEFLDFVRPGELCHLLSNATIYVHTAYIENSPNAICEAQYIGLPIVSTNVGGIASLVKDGVEGVLVPANDPWQMANEIVELANDDFRMKLYSENNRKHAHLRHDEQNILKQLLECYQNVLGEN